MKVFGQILTVLFAIALLAALGLGGYSAIKYSISLLGSLHFPAVSDTTLTSAVPFLAALIIARSIRRSSRQNKVNQLQSEKAETYRLFVDMYADLYQVRRDARERCAAELSEPVQTLDRLLVLFGSPAVIKAHAALRALEREHRTQDPNVRSQLGKALMEMRRDLGAKTLGLRAEDLLELLVPASQEVSPANAARDPNRDVALARNA